MTSLSLPKRLCAEAVGSAFLLATVTYLDPEEVAAILAQPERATPLGP